MSLKVIFFRWGFIAVVGVPLKSSSLPFFLFLKYFPLSNLGHSIKTLRDTLLGYLSIQWVLRWLFLDDWATAGPCHIICLEFSFAFLVF